MTSKEILAKLQRWQQERARREGVESYRILPFKALQEIAQILPRNKEELMRIKGIKDARFQRYGRDILSIVNCGVDNQENDMSGHVAAADLLKNNSQQHEAVYSVSTFLDGINALLGDQMVKISGEVTSVDVRQKVVYFTIKDQEDESTLNCIIFRYHYELSGVNMEIGKKVIVAGFPEIYKPSGRFSVKCDMIEDCGRGALKKAYDELKIKLKQEGFFDEKNKRQLQKFPETIGLITSQQGAAIGDFTMNIGRYGFKIKFYHTSVEGKKAVLEIIKAIKFFQKAKDIDVVVIIRGGGSLESLQAFNNEKIIREMKKITVPVICGIGHEHDETLATLAADIGVSTPTAAARSVRSSWDHATAGLETIHHKILSQYSFIINNKKQLCTKALFVTKDYLRIFKNYGEMYDQKIQKFTKNIQYKAAQHKKTLVYTQEKLLQLQKTAYELLGSRIAQIEHVLKLHDPSLQLKIGFTLTRRNGKIIRSAKHVHYGDILDIQFIDGKIITEVKKIK